MVTSPITAFHTLLPPFQLAMEKPPPTEVTCDQLVFDDVVPSFEVALTEVRSLKQPPLAVRRVLSSCFVILSCASGGTSTSTEVSTSTSNLRKSSRVKLPSWTTCQTMLEKDFVKRILDVDARVLSTQSNALELLKSAECLGAAATGLEEEMKEEAHAARTAWRRAANSAIGHDLKVPLAPVPLTRASVAFASKACAPLFDWCVTTVKEAIALQEEQAKKMEQEEVEDVVEIPPTPPQQPRPRPPPRLSLSDEVKAYSSSPPPARAPPPAPPPVEAAEIAHVDVVVKQKVTFEKGKATVTDANIPALLAVVEVLKDFPTCPVLEVVGRPDPRNSEDKEYCVKLSAERAEAVCKWLVSNGCGMTMGRLRATTMEPNGTSAGGRRKATSSELIESKFWHIKFNVVAEIRIRDMVCFGPSSSELTSQSEETLRAVAMCSKEHRLQRLTIEGHTCDQGPDNFNQELSEERAESVEKFLKQLGCGDMNLRVVGYGSKLPVDSNGCRDGRTRNRRVQFLCL